jgi:hypothetical protein
MTGKNVRTVLPTSLTKKMMEIAISESIYQELARHTALLARIEEKRKNTTACTSVTMKRKNQVDYGTMTRTQREGCNCEQDDCSLHQEDEVMLHDYWEELTGQDSIGTLQ